MTKHEVTMPRLIDADALKEYIGCSSAMKYGNETEEQRHKSYSTLMMYEIADYIDDAPTIDAEPVRHGRWVKRTGMMPSKYHGRHSCSICGYFALDARPGVEELSEHCPHCGAKMDGGAENA